MVYDFEPPWKMGGLWDPMNISQRTEASVSISMAGTGSTDLAPF